MRDETRWISYIFGFSWAPLLPLLGPIFPLCEIFSGDMVSHLSNGAVRASLTSTSRIYCAALASPSVPISVPASRGLTPRRPHSSRTSRYSSYASTHPTISVAQSTILTTSPSRSRSSASLRSYATASEPQLPQDIAVLGGGLTGLTTAYYLTRFHPDAKITIYEAADRLGGWIDTERVDVKTQQGNTATVTFERGARAVSPQTSLPRWEDFVLYDLVWRSFLTMGKPFSC